MRGSRCNLLIGRKCVCEEKREGGKGEEGRTSAIQKIYLWRGREGGREGREGGREGREGRKGGKGREESIKELVLPLPHSGMLKWKRGRLLGKGAYGKVWEGLMDSAKMIAVKEVELDCESAERAQAVSPGVMRGEYVTEPMAWLA